NNENRGKFHKIARYLKQKNIRMLFYKIKSGKQYAAARGQLTINSYDSNTKYDIVVIGSDEMWNVASKSFQHYPEYFAKGIAANSIISYAPSAGNATHDDFVANNVDFSGFGSLSVRDQRTYNLVSEFDNRRIERVLDPTFLLDSYSSYIPKIDISNDFIMVYSYGMSKDEIKMAKEFSKKTRLPLYSVGTYNAWCNKNIIVSPFEFLAYLDKAKYVITATFHGTALSINFNKQFAVCVEGSEKVKSLLREFDLENRIVTESKTISDLFSEKIDYEPVNQYMKKRREASVAYITNALESKCSDNTTCKEEIMGRVQINKEKCCGCSACAGICPKDAIHLEQDEKGFYYPQIDDNKCVNCGLCQKVCDFSKFMKDTTLSVSSFAVRHKCEEEVITSRSGGFFSAVAEHVINNGGVCYGAALTPELDVVHQKAESKVECLGFKGSKYVQSRIDEGLFKDCKKMLDSGSKVLFSGTGCQVHGLLSYLKQTGTDCANLITVDFVCHGVPSPGVWKEYVSQIQLKKKKKLKHVDFRDKAKFGWTAHVETYTYEDDSQESNSRWADVFYQHCMFREACYNCPYTTPYRHSDFTIGDYWGFEKAVDGYRDNKGLSFVIAQNEKALALLGKLKDTLEIHETDLSKSLQPQLQKPVYKGIEYNRFWKKWGKNKSKTVKSFFFPGIIRRLYLYGIKTAKKAVKLVIKKLKSAK
ncbi:MAG: polysaccharide pyruvyl transferase family protein, partial [Acutalibacteraceae bacterium]